MNQDSTSCDHPCRSLLRGTELRGQFLPAAGTAKRGRRGEFWQPILQVRPGRTGKSAPMPVPEAPVHEYDRSMARKDNIRAPRQICPVESEAKARPVQSRAHEPLRAGVLGSDRRHDAAARVDVDCVDHGRFDSLLRSHSLHRERDAKRHAPLFARARRQDHVRDVVSDRARSSARLSCRPAS